ncbi:MAG: type II toxin-antitoxin system RelB/DinJ family antitoxin [bacterium]|nr:type II toxin-antitoxin system RelB/DinJ family antitoxin [bacterium]
MKTALSVKVDKKVRDDARKVAKKLGVPLSMVVNQQLKQFARDRRIEFSEPLIPNARTKKILDEAMRDIREGNWDTFSPEFNNMKEAVAWLNQKKK